MKPLPTLLFLATTDSYIKWVNGLRLQVEPEWASTMFLARTLQNPSPRQTKVAVGEDAASKVRALHVLSILAWIRKHKPTAIVVGATGPFLVLLRWLLNFSKQGRQARLVSGSPGVAFHLIGSPLLARAYADLILVASRREWVRLGGDLSRVGAKAELGLATLPFLQKVSGAERFEGNNTLVFAPQPDMPKSKEDRRRLLLELAKLSEVLPDLEIRIKLRAVSKEPQTHFEKYPYPDLEAELVKEGKLTANSFNFVLGSISEQLRNTNAALITVSSTAALESISMGNPTHIISDFGSSDEIATSVFEGSGIVWPIADHAVARLQKPSPIWLDENYFHNRELDDWKQAIYTLSGKLTSNKLELLPKGLSKSLFFGEFLRVMLPNRLGKTLISSLKLLLGKNTQ